MAPTDAGPPRPGVLLPYSPTGRFAERHEVLGVEVQALTMEDLNRAIDDAVSAGRRLLVANHNAHSVYLHHHDPEMRRYLGLADLVHADGMSLVFAARLAGAPLRREHRTTYVDWIHPLLELASWRGWRVFHLGGRPEVVERARRELAGRHPGLEIRMHHGYFDRRPGSAENRRVLDRINEFDPHILLVGMGMPRQERWIVENEGALRAAVLLPCGACMDYVAGAIPTPPRWLARIGLEWLARLVSEPRRLARRYLLEPWFLLRLLAVDFVGRWRGAPEP